MLSLTCKDLHALTLHSAITEVSKQVTERCSAYNAALREEMRELKASDQQLQARQQQLSGRVEDLVLKVASAEGEALERERDHRTSTTTGSGHRSSSDAPVWPPVMDEPGDVEEPAVSEGSGVTPGKAWRNVSRRNSLSSGRVPLSSSPPIKSPGLKRDQLQISRHWLRKVDLQDWEALGNVALGRTAPQIMQLMMEVVCRLLGYAPNLPPTRSAVLEPILNRRSTAKSTAKGSKAAARRPSSAANTRRAATRDPGNRKSMGERPRSAAPASRQGGSGVRGQANNRKQRPNSARPIKPRTEVTTSLAAGSPLEDPAALRRGYWRAGIGMVREDPERLTAALLALAPVEVPQEVLQKVQQLLKEAETHLNDDAYKENLRRFCWGGVDVCIAISNWAKALCSERQQIRPAVLELAQQKALMEKAEERQRKLVQLWKGTCNGVSGLWFDAFITSDRQRILVGDRYLPR